MGKIQRVVISSWLMSLCANFMDTNFPKKVFENVLNKKTQDDVFLLFFFFWYPAALDFKVRKLHRRVIYKVSIELGLPPDRSVGFSNTCKPDFFTAR